MSLPFNTAFSETTANLQLYWDSTSLGALKTCPRLYQLSIILGYQPRKRSVDLEFGIWLHEGRERYYHARAAGASHDDGVDKALCHILSSTWDRVLGRPWSSEDNNKNRFTLVRTLVWYLDQWENDPLETIHLANGKPAVELSFGFATDFASRSGEQFSLSGHLDRIARLGDDIHPTDLKSTRHTLDHNYFAQFTPDNQFSLYTFATKVVWQLPSRSLIVDAAQVAVSFSRFQRAPIARTERQLEEWYKGLGLLFEQAETYARADFWPLNEKACFRCSMRPICSRDPSTRDLWLKTDYTQRMWNPRIARGDI